MRTKQIDIAGGSYWIAYSEGVKIMMRDTYGVDCDDEKSFTDAMKVAEKRLGLVHSCMVYGAKWAHLTGRDVQDPPSFDDFAALVDQYDVMGVFPDIRDVISGERNVVSKPTKKSKAGASASNPAK